MYLAGSFCENALNGNNSSIKNNLIIDLSFAKPNIYNILLQIILGARAIFLAVRSVPFRISYAWSNYVIKHSAV